jgi:hypothetical protein
VGSIAIAAGVLSLACNALLGEKDIYFDPDAAASAPDGVAPPPGPGPVDGGGDAIDAPTGACVDVTADPKNCGRCGHDCLGGGCEAGACLPVPLVPGGSPRAIALDTAHVFWTDSNSARVGQVGKDGTGRIDLALGGTKNSYPIGIATDGANMFWGGIEDELFRCKIGGCANTPSQVTSTGGTFTDLVVDDTKVYWLDGMGAGRIASVNKGTILGAGGASVAPGAFNRIAQDAQFLYVTSDDGNVRRIAKSNGAVNIVAKALGKTFGIAVDDTNVYFTDGDDPATIDVAAKIATNATPTPLAAAQHNPEAIASDATNLYWVNTFIGIGPDGKIMTCPFTNCATPVVLADNQHAPISIAVDATAIYWVNFDFGNGSGGVMKLAKP